MLAEELNTKWKPVLEHSDLPEITDAHKRLVTATVLENTERALREASGQGSSQQMLGEADGHVNSVGSGQVANFDPVLISLDVFHCARRSRECQIEKVVARHAP